MSVYLNERGQKWRMHNGPCVYIALHKGSRRNSAYYFDGRELHPHNVQTMVSGCSREESVGDIEAHAAVMRSEIGDDGRPTSVFYEEQMQFMTGDLPVGRSARRNRIRWSEVDYYSWNGREYTAMEWRRYLSRVYACEVMVSAAYRRIGEMIARGQDVEIPCVPRNVMADIGMTQSVLATRSRLETVYVACDSGRLPHEAVIAILLCGVTGIL